VTEEGLADVAVRTSISAVDGELGKLWYAGYSIEDLAEHSTFEETFFLVQHRRLPTQAELDELTEQMVEYREAEDFVTGLIPTLAEQTSPMSMLRTGVSAASAHDPDGWDQSPEAVYRKAVRITSLIPTLVAHYDRHRRGLPVVDPNPKLPHAADFLYMLSGEEPTQEAARALDVAFVLCADRTMSPSTFAARVVASTLSDVHSAVVAAIAALKGPLHGGANELAVRMLQEIGSPERVEPHVRDLFARGERVMGFGHPVFRHVEDPRATILKRLTREVAEASGKPAWYETAEAIERVVLAERGLRPNVDFAMGSLLLSLGLPVDLCTPTFAAARVAGWTAHVREQYGDDRIIGPGSEYTGPRDRVYVPVEERTVQD
jgi:citrate synthase